MSTHTPGKWNWDSDPLKSDPLSRVRYRVVTRGKTITQLYYSSDDPHALADARLISAAPDLLATSLELQRIRQEGTSADKYEAAIRAHDAAIAKAKGETL